MYRWIALWMCHECRTWIRRVQNFHMGLGVGAPKLVSSQLVPLQYSRPLPTPMYESHYCFNHLYILNGTCFFYFVLFCFIYLWTKDYQKGFSLAQKEQDSWLYTAFFSKVPSQLHTLVPSSLSIGKTQYLGPQPALHSSIQPSGLKVWFFSLENRWKSLGAVYGE